MPTHDAETDPDATGAVTTDAEADPDHDPAPDADHDREPEPERDPDDAAAAAATAAAVDAIDVGELPDPGDGTVTDVKDWVREHDPVDAHLYALEQLERDGENRSTLTEWLADRHDFDPDAETADTDEPAGDDAAPAREGPPRETDVPTLGDDDYDPAVHAAWAPGEVPTPDDIPLVAVAPPGEGSYAGYWFEGGRPKVVRRTKRVDRAIVDGPLDYRGDAGDHSDGDTL